MTKVFIIQGGDLESYYQLTMDYLHAKYHTYPSMLLDINEHGDVNNETGYCESMVENLINNVHDNQKTPLGKLVL